VIVSIVGEIADFASQSNGPSPTTTSAISSRFCPPPYPDLIDGRRQSDGEISA